MVEKKSRTIKKIQKIRMDDLEVTPRDNVLFMDKLNEIIDYLNEQKTKDN